MGSVAETLDLVVSAKELIDGRDFRAVVTLIEPIPPYILMAEPELGHYLAQAYSQTDAPDRCAALLDELHEAGRHRGNDRLYRRRLNLRAVLKLRGGLLSEAESLFEAVASASVDASDETFLATAMMNIGVVADMRCDWERAGSNYRQALVLFQRIGDRASMAGCYHNLGMLSRQCGKLGEAEQYLRRALENYKTTGTADERTATGIERGLVAAELGDPTRGICITMQALRKAQEIRNLRLLGEAHRACGLIFLHRRELRHAHEHFRAALRVEARQLNPMLRAEIFEGLSWLFAMAGRYGQEAFYASSAADTYSAIGMAQRASRATQRPHILKLPLV